MAESSTIARPYAKAAFEFALENKALDQWSKALDLLAIIANDENAQILIKNPNVSNQQRVEFFEGVGADLLDEKMKNFVRLLAENNRLLELPELNQQFNQLKADYEKTVDVELVSATKMTEATQKIFAEKLAAKLGRKVSIENNVDPSLIGGLIVKAEDLVIDGSISGKIAKLSESLAF